MSSSTRDSTTRNSLKTGRWVSKNFENMFSSSPRKWPKGSPAYPGNTIVDTARAIAAAKGASLVMYTGLEYTNSGVQNITGRAMSLGHNGEHGCSRRSCVQTPQPGAIPSINLDPPKGVKPIGTDKYPIFLRSAQIGAVHGGAQGDPAGRPLSGQGPAGFGASLLTSLPNPDLWKECFRKLDFLVSIRPIHDGRRNVCGYRASRHHEF